ncbi:sodium:proton antiporter [Gordonia oryzae]|uniref:Sodium:proton antiporter n=1 Tax=Gordonia oryzae TaxID=2487349 RepID=A0A3N4HFZ5_9ACTN|nr:cation:proton antiporter [Gordonia oryzae]RPA65864.1 sodium:proton antiporter [Gordonia oryzae]
MATVVLFVAGSLLVWAAGHQLLLRLTITGPLLMVAIGGCAGWLFNQQALTFFDSKLALYLAEVILALLLFVDAIDVRGSVRSHLTAVPIRLLAIALPLSLLFVVILGLSLPLGLSVVAILAISCLAVPVDFSPEISLIRNRRIPESVRRWLTIESGYNDGLVSPFLLATLALATTTGDPRDQAISVFLKAAPSGAIAVGVGLVVGTAAGWLFRQAAARGWSDERSTRLGVLALPMFTFALAVLAHGNGFVSSFVCGVAVRIALSRNRSESEVRPNFRLAEDVAELTNLILWLAFGAASVALLAGALDWWPAIVLAGFVLTLGRMLPVLLSLAGSGVNWRDRTFMATMGPRGAASIVFGLIAFNALPGDDGIAVLSATCIIVLGSLLLHGMGAPVVIRALYGPATTPTARRRRRRTRSDQQTGSRT